MKKEAEIAIWAAYQAGNLLMDHLHRTHQIQHKGETNLVSEMDHRAEALIRDALSSAFPLDGFLCEESPLLSGNNRRIWVIDPLDGTTNYLHAYPMFGVSIALVENGEIILGVVYNPILDELFFAQKGAGATLNHRPIHVSATSSLKDALISTGFPYDAWITSRDNIAEFRHFLKRVVSVRVDGAAALDLCYVAMGRLDAYWDPDLEPWDMAAGALIIQESGGRVSSHYGDPFELSRRNILGTNGLIHAEMLDVLQALAPGNTPA